MTTTLNAQTTHSSVLSGTQTDRSSRENLITDALLARALQAILQITTSDEQVQARHLREKAGFTMCETAQVLQYLFRQGVLQAEVDGKRAVDRSLARDYLSIIAPPEEVQTKTPSEATSPFTQAHISWGCFIARQGKLTPTRIARPSSRTRDMAEALGLSHHGDTQRETLFTSSRANALCAAITEMSEQDRTSSLEWAELQLQHKQASGSQQ